MWSQRRLFAPALALAWALIALSAIGAANAEAALKCGGKAATIKGSGGADNLRGTRKADVMNAKGGADTVDGRGGNDRICGGGGNDTLKGGDGNDKLFGQANDDSLSDTAGSNTLDGGDGSDQCSGAPADQIVHCEPPPVLYTLTIDVSGTADGTGSVTGPGISCPGDCSEEYADGTDVTLTAGAAAGSAFAGWTGGCFGVDTCMLEMTADRAATATFDPVGTVFASSLVGDDTNTGTSLAPVATITQGITRALAIGTPADVIVGEGSYPEKVTVADGVNLLGGHDCAAVPCSWGQATGSSTILDQDFEGVLLGAAISRSTHLDGFTIAGKDGTPGGTTGAAVTIAGGSPTLSANQIQGGIVSGSDKASAAILIDSRGNAPGPLIDANTVIGGPATDAAIGIGLSSVAGPEPAAVLTVTGNTIHAGDGTSSIGVELSAGAGSGSVIRSNQIQTGSSVSGGWGMTLAGGPTTVDSNLINADQANVGTCSGVGCGGGGIYALRAAGTLTNNVILGVKAPVSVALQIGDRAPVQNLSVNGNYLDGAGLPTVTASTISVAISLFSAGGAEPNTVGSIRNNILVGGRNQARFGGIEQDAHAQPAAFTHNDFFFSALPGTTDVLYRQGEGINHTTTAGVNAIPGFAANAAADCLVNSTFHLGSGSPCINAGTTFGAPATDFDGQPRPQGGVVDIGPDEAG